MTSPNTITLKIELPEDVLDTLEAIKENTYASATLLEALAKSVDVEGAFSGDDEGEKADAKAPANPAKKAEPETEEKPKTTRRRRSKKAEEPKKQEVETVGFDELRLAAKRFVDTHGKQAISEVLVQFQAERLSALAEEKYADFVAALEVYQPGEDDEGDDDDLLD